MGRYSGALVMIGVVALLMRPFLLARLPEGERE